MKTKKSQILSLLIVLTLSLSLTGCKEKKEEVKIMGKTKAEVQAQFDAVSKPPVIPKNSNLGKVGYTYEEIMGKSKQNNKSK